MTSRSKPGHVDTPYGPLPGCPTCGVIPLGKPHVCEHGVTPAPSAGVSMTFSVDAETIDIPLGPP